jgi:hypothetical protein
MRMPRYRIWRMTFAESWPFSLALDRAHHALDEKALDERVDQRDGYDADDGHRRTQGRQPAQRFTDGAVAHAQPGRQHILRRQAFARSWF